MTKRAFAALVFNVVVSVALAAQANAALPRYRMAILESLSSTIPGGAANAINESGHVVGYADKYNSMGLLGPRAARWPAPGTIVELGTLDQDLQLYSINAAADVNASGVAVGVASSAFSNQRAAYWPLGEISPQLLKDLPNKDGYSSAIGVNNAGVIVGGTSRIDRSFAVRWDSFDAVPVPLADAEYAGFSVQATGAEEINEAGASVGEGRWLGGTGTNPLPLYWNSAGTSHVLPAAPYTPPNEHWGVAHDINEQGVVVGAGRAFTEDGSALGILALKWMTSTEEPVVLEHFNSLPGFVRNDANAINSLGVAVGMAIAFDQTGTSTYRALAWDDAGAVSDLSSLVDNLENWTLLWAEDVNDRGQIVGHALGPDGYGYPFVLNPVPEPSTLVVALWACGTALALAPHQRRR